MQKQFVLTKALALTFSAAEYPLSLSCFSGWCRSAHALKKLDPALA